MRTHWTDFVYAFAGLLIAGISAFLCSALFSSLISKPFFGAYYVIADGLFFVFMFGVACGILVKLLLRIYPFVPGSYAMDSVEFSRWKLFMILSEFGRKALGPFSVVFARPLIERLFGARIGKNTAIAGKLIDGHMIELADEAIVGEDSIVSAHYIINGKLTLRPVRIGKGATVGGGAIVACSNVGDGSSVIAASFVSPGTEIPGGELWGGFPARRIRRVDESPEQTEGRGRRRL